MAIYSRLSIWNQEVQDQGKSALLNSINNQPDIDKIYLYEKDPYEAKYHFLINKKESTGLMYFKDLKTFIEYSNDTQNVYKKY